MILGDFYIQVHTVKTFEIAGHLIQYNFDRNQVFNGMYEKEAKLITIFKDIYIKILKWMKMEQFILN